MGTIGLILLVFTLFWVAVIFYLTFQYLRLAHIIKKLTIGELIKSIRDIQNQYENLTENERFTIGWYYLLLMKKIDKRLIELQDII